MNGRGRGWSRVVWVIAGYDKSPPPPTLLLLSVALVVPLGCGSAECEWNHWSGNPLKRLPANLSVICPNKAAPYGIWNEEGKEVWGKVAAHSLTSRGDTRLGSGAEVLAFLAWSLSCTTVANHAVTASFISHAKLEGGQTPKRPITCPDFTLPRKLTVTILMLVLITN